MANGGKLHLRAAAPFAHLTVCGRPVEGREREIVPRLLDRHGSATCQSCWRMRAQAAPVAGRASKLAGDEP
jgi:hypothetical protein